MTKKRLFLALAATLMGFGLVLRFVEIQAPPLTASPPPKSCLSGETGPSPAATDANGEPLPACAELEAINQAYAREIRPIFEAKCLMCHGVVPRMPLYSVVPPFSWLVRYDIREAQEHMNMSFGFPFVGKKGDVAQDGLEDLIDVVDENEMPPVIYKTVHWKSGLTPAERAKIRAWATQGLKTLND